MKELTSRQAQILFMYYTLISKVVILPSILCSEAGKSFWLVLLLLFALDFIFIFALIRINNKDANTTLRQKMEKCFGKIATNIFYFLIGIILLIKLSISIHEFYIFLYDILYVDLSWLTILVPLFIYILYVAKQNLRIHGRSLEMYGFLILVAVSFAVFDGIRNINAVNYLPLISTSAPQTLTICSNLVIWFGDFLALFFILGNVKIEKNTTAQLFRGWAIAVAVTFVVVIVFWGELGMVTSIKRVAIIDLTQHTPRVNASASFVWLVTFLWPIAGIFEISFLAYLSSNAFTDCFCVKQKNKIFVIISVLLSVILILSFTRFRIYEIFKFEIYYFKYFVIVVQYLLVLVMIIGLSVNKRWQVKYVK